MAGYLTKDKGITEHTTLNDIVITLTTLTHL